MVQIMEAKEARLNTEQNFKFKSASHHK